MCKQQQMGRVGLYECHQMTVLNVKQVISQNSVVEKQGNSQSDCHCTAYFVSETTARNKKVKVQSLF